MLACAKIGAVIIPLFSGYGPEAVASRLRDGEAKVLLCADGFYRRGAVVDMKVVADEAAAMSPSVQSVIVQRRVGAEIVWKHGRDRVWDQVVEDEPIDFETRLLEPESDAIGDGHLLRGGRRFRPGRNEPAVSGASDVQRLIGLQRDGALRVGVRAR